MRIGAILASGGCRTLRWTAMSGVALALGAGQAAAQTFTVDDSFGEGGDWDVIHFNFGLHDLKRIDPETGKGSNNPDDPYQASPERYEAQLREIVRSLQKTGAHLIFATTTPVPTGVRPYRAPEDAVEYNRIAVGVMEKAGIEVNDLYGLALPYLATLQQPENVHFTKDGSYALSLAVVQSVGRKRVVASSQGSWR